MQHAIGWDWGIIMPRNDDFTAAIAAATKVADLGTKQSAFEKATLALVVDPLLVKCNLIAARDLYRRHGDIIRLAIERSAKAKLKALSTAWNKHRPESADTATADQLVRELIALLDGSKQPDIKLPPPPPPTPDPAPPAAKKKTSKSGAKSKTTTA